MWTKLKIRLFLQMFGKDAFFFIFSIKRKDRFFCGELGTLYDKNLETVFDSAMENEPEVREWLLERVAKYLKSYEIERDNFAKQIYNQD